MCWEDTPAYAGTSYQCFCVSCDSKWSALPLQAGSVLSCPFAVAECLFLNDIFSSWSKLIIAMLAWKHLCQVQTHYLLKPINYLHGCSTDAESFKSLEFVLCLPRESCPDLCRWWWRGANNCESVVSFYGGGRGWGWLSGDKDLVLNCIWTFMNSYHWNP